MAQIERKFLLNSIPEFIPISYDDNEQVYLCFDPEIKIIKIGNKHFISQRDEGTEMTSEKIAEIDVPTYQILTNLRNGRIINKTRYRIPVAGGLVVGLDIYHEELKGLVIVEAEFDSLEEANSFIPPVWFDEEVTEDNNYTNKNLAQIDDNEIKNIIKQNESEEDVKIMKLHKNT